MRTVKLSKTGIAKLRSSNFEMKISDFDNSIKSLGPGEWVKVQDDTGLYLSFMNPLVDERQTCCYVVKKLDSDDKVSVIEFIHQKIKSARDYRLEFSQFKNGRIFYGGSDGLPGFIIDEYQNAIVIQINTAGLDNFRLEIKKFLEELSQKKSYFLDNPKYREREVLPMFEADTIPNLLVSENDLEYIVLNKSLQKVGFYFDHRDNRLQLTHILRGLRKTFVRGLDLYSYVGAWGVTALSSGVERMIFVDQGNFNENITQNLKLNGLENRGEFVRSDVYHFLDELIKTGDKTDLILSDPPAFAKSFQQKHQALDGYSKLHRKVLKIISPGGLACFSSCTHYVTDDEFQKTILDSASKEGRSLRLIYSGHQGYDHPVNSKSDKANYIKSYFYIVE